MFTRVISADPLSPDHSGLEYAAKLIKNGDIVAFPTETVYGLGASGCNEDAVKSIFAAKGRPSDNPLILHFSDIGMLDRYACVNERFLKLYEIFMPGPLTCVLKSRNTAAPSVQAGLDTVAVRFPVHPVAREFIRLSGVPIAAPSANLSGRPSPTSWEHVYDDFAGRIPLIIDGGMCSVGLESTIVTVYDGNIRLLRPGGITLEQLRGVFPDIKVSDAVLNPPAPGSRPESPGMLLRHYSPKAPFYLVKSADPKKLSDFFREKSIEPGNIIISPRMEDADYDYLCLGGPEDYEEQARNLFAMLRKADSMGAVNIFAPEPPDGGVGLAMLNRMLRAASFKVIQI